ncbi:MAG: twin-arginine translocase TatA/TatE family subunit [Solidesulfovibrio sp. DCME]|uniref:twin-arginine translocase TatA/TatE family subunit n=1 Tax=Solidesulfovibrio sp. DCME TaxID=3447380 RepID=UPI003D0F6A66
MGIFEPHHLILIIIIALIIFGPGKIADLGGQLGRGIRDFKKAMHEEEAPAQAQTAPAAEPVREIRQAEANVVEPAAAAKEVAQSH